MTKRVPRTRVGLQQVAPAPAPSIPQRWSGRDRRLWPVILLGWRADRYSRTPAARPDVPQLADIEFIPCAGRLADRRVPFAAAQ
jgi:hypothetical protein